LFGRCGSQATLIAAYLIFSQHKADLICFFLLPQKGGLLSKGQPRDGNTFLAASLNFEQKGHRPRHDI